MMIMPKIPPKSTKKNDTRPREEFFDKIEYLRAEVDYLKSVGP